MSAAALLCCLLPLVQDPVTPADEVLDVLVVSGANNHDCEWTTPRLARALQATGRFRAEVTTEPASALADAAALARYRAFVLDYNGPRWGEDAERNFLDAVRGGAGVVVVHAANNAFPGWTEYEKLVGLCWRDGTGHGRFHAFDVTVVDRDHPLTADMPDMVGHTDELYHKLVHMHGVELRVLARAKSSVESGGSGEDEPVVIVGAYGQGRVFHTPLGHVWRGQPGTRASYDAAFEQLVVRGTEWAATGQVTLSPQPPNALLPEERAAGFRLLFDGETTRGWRGYRREGFPERGWRVEGGCLTHAAAGGGGDLITAEQFGDFELRFEWAVAKGANSGVIYRCTEEAEASWQTGPEYQVLDDGLLHPDELSSAGALYGLVAPAGAVLRPVGQFNRARIVVRGTRIEHWLNGTVVVDCDMATADGQARIAASKFKDMPGFAAARRGHIALQDHGDAVRYRSLRVRELAPAPQAQEQRERG